MPCVQAEQFLWLYAETQISLLKQHVAYPGMSITYIVC
jgi:hypothetical protein